MKILFDFFPILLFFIAFKFYGIYYATGIAMAASLLQVGLYWIKHRRFELMHIVTLICVLLLGGATLLLHNELFIKWKPTAIYWIFSLIFLITQFIGNKTLIQRLMEEKIELSSTIWSRLNMGWAIFFILMGFANLYVAYHYDTNIWVNFKLFGSIGLTLLFVIAQSFYIAKHAQAKPEKE